MIKTCEDRVGIRHRPTDRYVGIQASRDLAPPLVPLEDLQGRNVFYKGIELTGSSAMACKTADCRSFFRIGLSPLAIMFGIGITPTTLLLGNLLGIRLRVSAYSFNHLLAVGFVIFLIPLKHVLAVCFIALATALRNFLTVGFVVSACTIGMGSFAVFAAAAAVAIAIYRAVPDWRIPLSIRPATTGISMHFPPAIVRRAPPSRESVLATTRNGAHNMGHVEPFMQVGPSPGPFAAAAGTSILAGEAA